MKVWILFYEENVEYPPPKAFEKLFWKKPTYEDLKEYGFTKKQAKNPERRVSNWSGDEFWVECFWNKD